MVLIRFGAIAVAAAAIAGCGGPSGSASPATPPLVQAPLLPGVGTTLDQSSDWPTAAHDFLRSGLQPLSGGLAAGNVAQLQLVWTYTSAGVYESGGPIVVGNSVYALDRSGNVVALDATSGQPLWHRALGVASKMAPAFLDGHLFVGTYDDTSASAQSTLYALDPFTGSIQWQRSIDGGLHGAPVSLDGNLFVPVAAGDPGLCHPGGVYVFNEKSGAPGAFWRTVPDAPAAGGAVWGSLTYDGTQILFGTGNTCGVAPSTANAVVAIDSGANLEWTYQTAQAQIDDDVGSNVMDYSGSGYVTGKVGSTYAVDTATGNVRWQRQFAGDQLGGFSTPELVGSTLVTSGGYRYDPYQPPAGPNGTLYGLDPASGSTKWTITAQFPFWAPIASTNDLVFTTADTSAVALDPATGTTLWSKPLATISHGQPALAEGRVYVTDIQGHLYAFALPTTGNALLRKRAATNLALMRRAASLRPIALTRPRYCLRRVGAQAMRP